MVGTASSELGTLRCRRYGELVLGLLDYATRWSLTLGVPNADLPYAWHARFERWLHAQNSHGEDYCEEGAGSMEMGDKKFLLHLQGIFKSHISATDTGIKRMRDTFNEFMGRCPERDGTKMTLKPFAQGQEVREMGGYVFKDQGMPHFRCVFKGVHSKFTANLNTFIR